MPRRSGTDATDRLTIGDRIRTRRLLRDWSIRFAASRAGISHATWSRIERGLQAADNRFIISDIAAALECTPSELTGSALPNDDPAVTAAQLRLHAMRRALVDIDLADPLTQPSRSIAELRRDTDLARDLHERCDYEGATQLLPGLLRELHSDAARSLGEESLRLLYKAAFTASSVTRTLGHPGEAWLAAERCREIAEAIDDPVLVSHAGLFRAVAAGACGSFDRARRISELHIEAIQPHTGLPGGLEVLGMLYLMASMASRGLKQRDRGSDLLAEAVALAARTGETRSFGLYFGPTNVNLWRIAEEADGGDPDHATRIAATTNPNVLGIANRKVFYFTDSARALARTRGKEQEAIRLLLAAERLAPQHIHCSMLVRETARALLDRSQRQATGTPLRALCHRLGMPT
jgi:transcriptional regulator with XRE-family HTH domain